MNNFIRSNKIHFLCWGTFIIYEILVVGAVTASFGAFWDYFAHYAINISLFYFHATMVLPFALQKGSPRYWLIPFLVAGELLAYIALVYAVEFALSNYFHVRLSKPLAFDYLFFIRSTWRAIYFVGFATGYYYLMVAFRERRRAENAEKQHLLHIIEKQNLQHELIKSQNAFLKAQINPHFLFNTLNFVYNSVRKTSGQAAETVLSLSQMMRYALESGEDGDETSLLEEVEQVENLIYIHQIRHDNQLQVKMTYGSNLAGLKIIPLVLITLVENIFKHGDLTRHEHPAVIDISLEENRLTVRTANLRATGHPTGHRIGLDNIVSRLRLAYKDRASFNAYADTMGYFHTILKITLPEEYSKSVTLERAKAEALSGQPGRDFH